MNKAFEKILERLDNYIEDAKSEGDFSYIKPFEIAKRAVQEVAKEYNGGWIPCSERLPDVSRCRVTVKYDMEVGDPVYDTLDADFEKYQGGYKFKDSWMNDITNNVIAWQPLPQPYKERE